jgi:hypothetical protein
MADQTRIEYSYLFEIINKATDNVKSKVDLMKEQGSNISIGDMFETQMLTNRLAQLSEMTGALVSSMHTATMSMARNVKG